MDLAFLAILETQDIIKSVQLRSQGNKLVPLHSSQVKANKSERHIIGVWCSVEELQKKCDINSTKEISLVAIGSKAPDNHHTHMILMLPREGIHHDSSIRRRSVARVVTSQHPSGNIICEIPEVGKQDVGDLLAMKIPRVSVAK